MKTAKRVTVPQFAAMKAEGRKISMVTAYDYPMARLVDEAGVDAILVGDTLAMVVQGHETTLPVSIEEMIYHAEIVGRAAKRSMVVVDLPFPVNHLGVHAAIGHAGRILKESRCQAVKLEGGADQADVVAGLVSAGIPVMAHVGLRPQSVHQLGGYKIQRDTDRLIKDAQVLEQAGAFSVLLECVQAEVAARITDTLQVPTIGIGSGSDCDGQVLVLHDLLGLTQGRIPKFVKRYANLSETVKDAVRRFSDDVRGGTFPGESQTFR